MNCEQTLGEPTQLGYFSNGYEKEQRRSGKACTLLYSFAYSALRQWANPFQP
jgi:hypothetical protein